MQVESFECTETASEPIEASEEAIGLIEKLGLNGQKELVTKDEVSGRDQRCPYRLIRADERFVYLTICPSVQKLESYKSSPIPLRVLQIAAHAKDLGIFKELRVWSQEDSTVKDPVLVGVVGHPSYDWMDKDTYILARWGDELETFSVLLKRAANIARERLVDSAKRVLSSVEQMSVGELVELGPASKVGVANS